MNSVTAGGLEFVTVNGNFTISGSKYTVSSGVQDQASPRDGAGFTPLARLDGSITIDTSTLSLAGSGTLSTIISRTTIPLLSGGLGTTSITTLVSNGLSSLSGASLTVASTTFTLNSIQLNSTGPEIELQGSIALPEAIGLTRLRWTTATTWISAS